MDGSFFRLRMQLPSFRPILDLCMCPVQKRSDGVDRLDFLGSATFYTFQWLVDYMNDYSKLCHQRFRMKVLFAWVWSWLKPVTTLEIMRSLTYPFFYRQHRSISWFSFPQFQPIWVYTRYMWCESLPRAHNNTGFVSWTTETEVSNKLSARPNMFRLLLKSLSDLREASPSLYIQTPI